MRLIDIHTHIYPPAIARKAAASIREFYQLDTREMDGTADTLLPQAGVALGMAMTAVTLENGALARNVVLFAVLIYELVGPAMTKRSLLAAGEIQPEGRVSARRHNQPKPNQ